MGDIPWITIGLLLVGTWAGAIALRRTFRADGLPDEHTDDQRRPRASRQ